MYVEQFVHVDMWCCGESEVHIAVSCVSLHRGHCSRRLSFMLESIVYISTLYTYMDSSGGMQYKHLYSPRLSLWEVKIQTRNKEGVVILWNNMCRI
jgi:hypothetical protein